MRSLSLWAISLLILAGCQMSASRPTSDTAGIPGWAVNFFMDAEQMSSTEDERNSEITISGEELAIHIPDDGKDYELYVFEMETDRTVDFPDVCGEEDSAIIPPSSSDILIMQQPVSHGEPFELTFSRSQNMGGTTEIIVALKEAGTRYDQLTIVAAHYDLSPLTQVPFVNHDVGQPRAMKCNEI